MNVSPQQVPFDLTLRGFFPKNKVMSQLGELKGGKLKMSNDRQQNNYIQKYANFHEPGNPIQSYQPQHRNGTCTTL